MTKIPYIIQGPLLVMILDGEPITIGADHPKYMELKEALIEGDRDFVLDNYSLAAKIEKFVKGSIEVIDGHLTYRGVPMDNSLSRRIVEMFRAGDDIGAMEKFLANLSKNPDPRAINELYDFLSACNLPITSDGHFLAYKYVREDWNDCYSNTVYNKPISLYTDEDFKMFSEGPKNNNRGVEYGVRFTVDGPEAYVEMTRNLVDPDKNRTCSTGLHFASIRYVRGATNVVAVKINPADVVAIPADYNHTKGRCCRYTIVNHVNELDKAFLRPVQDKAHEVDEAPVHVDGWDYYDKDGW